MEVCILTDYKTKNIQQHEELYWVGMRFVQHIFVSYDSCLLKLDAVSLSEWFPTFCNERCFYFQKSNNSSLVLLPELLYNHEKEQRRSKIHELLNNLQQAIS